MSSLDPSSLADQIISCSHFRMALKEIIQELNQEQKSKEASTIDGETTAEVLIEEIGEQMEIIARQQAQKQLRISEELIRQSYELRRKQFFDEMEAKIDKQIKKLHEYIEEQIENLRSCRISELSLNQSVQKTQSTSRIKRKKIKEMIFQSQTSFDEKKSQILQPIPITNIDMDGQFGKLSHQLTEMREQVNKSLQKLNEKIKNQHIKTQNSLCKIETSFKEQMEGNFEGIWNIISNLEKRMLDENSQHAS